MGAQFVEGIANDALAVILVGVVTGAFGIVLVLRGTRREVQPVRHTETLPVAVGDAGDDCPICLSAVSSGLQTNCDHWLCACCFLGLWRAAGVLHPASCPLCRRRVVLLFVHREAQLSEQDAEAVQQYNRRFGGSSPALQDVPLLLRHFLQQIDSGASLPSLLGGAGVALSWASVAYLSIPYDLIPEAAAGLVGLTDDFLVFILLFCYLLHVYRRNLVV
mmetsp:Transcript_37527/g.98263  ORF Transcript_37527/g.98263 Transcript_37527/m.98263 type:complete len:219 (-) Transcript_37527:6-662(-)